jgi:hypothetical protein
MVLPIYPGAIRSARVHNQVHDRAGVRTRSCRRLLRYLQRIGYDHSRNVRDDHPPHPPSRCRLPRRRPRLPCSSRPSPQAPSASRPDLSPERHNSIAAAKPTPEVRPTTTAFCSQAYRSPYSGIIPPDFVIAPGQSPCSFAADCFPGMPQICTLARSQIRRERVSFSREPTLHRVIFRKFGGDALTQGSVS